MDNKLKNSIKSRIVKNKSLSIELLKKHDKIINDYVLEMSLTNENLDILIQKIIMAILIKETRG